MSEMAKIDYREREKELERKGLYDVDMNEDHRYFDALEIDENYNYLPTKITEKLRRLYVLSVVKVVGPIITWIGMGAKVKGRKNLRALGKGGAISVCNHVHNLDTLLMKNALGPFRVFHTGNYYLLKRGWLGKNFKSGGFLPVGTEISDMRRLQETVGELVSKGKIVNFYPEHALWPRYEKLRPFKPGAFRYAVKFNVPVLPVFIEFKMTKLRKLLHRKKKMIVHILPAQYAPETGSVRARAEALCEAVFAAMRAEGERLYGKNVDCLAQEAEEVRRSVPVAEYNEIGTKLVETGILDGIAEALRSDDEEEENRETRTESA